MPVLSASLWAWATLIAFLLPLPVVAASLRNFLTRLASAAAIASGLVLTFFPLPVILAVSFFALLVDLAAFLDKTLALEMAFFAFADALAASAFCLAVALLQGFLTAIFFF